MPDASDFHKRDLKNLLDQCDLAGEQHVKYMKIDIGFKQPLKKFHVEETDGFLVFEGDIILDDVRDALEKGNIIINKYKWPSHRIPYAYDPDCDPEGSGRSWFRTIERAVKTINEQTNVELYRLEAPGTEVDHIFFNQGAGDGRLHAIIGHRPGRGRHEVVLSGFFTVGKALHEIGHALGLWHEHTRSDRDEHIEVLWDNVRDESICVFKVWEDISLPHGPYDFASVMHYDAFSANFAIDPEKPVMRPRNDQFEILGQRERLSEGDIAAINALYPADGQEPAG